VSITEVSNTLLHPSSANLGLLEQVEVEYETLPGWESSIESVRKYEDLPANCRAYVEYIERQLEVPVEWIGVGPGREAMIHRPQAKVSIA
jgi:adenylosuccinate synthase